jgi:O-antigen/teichoic acid export membrane protein
VILPNVWGLVVGNLLASLASSLISYLLTRNVRHRLRLDKQYVREILVFGKWIFLSSIIYFLATNFDRLMLAKYVSFAVLGIYSVARSLGDVLGQFAGKIGYAIIFPGVASSNWRGRALRSRLAHRRMQFLTGVVFAIAGLIAFSDVIISVLYDDRYLGAARVLPLVALAIWFGVLSTLNENVLLGLGKPMYGAAANVAKLVVLVVLLPLGALDFGILGAAWAAVAAEVARVGCLTLCAYKEKVGFGRQDAVATALMLLSVGVIRIFSYELGMTGSPAELASGLT